MKPTNDERRDVAAKLREHIGKHLFTGQDVEGIIGVQRSDFDALLADASYRRLAELIEPEERTCERGIEMFSHAYPNEIVCDSDCVSTYVFPLTCGHEVELLENKWPSYCPHCGARVVADD